MAPHGGLNVQSDTACPHNVVGGGTSSTTDISFALGSAGSLQCDNTGADHTMHMLVGHLVLCALSPLEIMGGGWSLMGTCNGPGTCSCGKKLGAHEVLCCRWGL